MTKLALVSDVHLSSQNPLCRKDDLRVVQWRKLQQVYNIALDEDCCGVVFSGDLVDVACSWSLLPELAEFLYKTDQAIDTYTVFGQHDTYMYDAVGRRKTIIGSLAAAGLIKIIDHLPTALPKTSTFLYGASYGQPIPEHKLKNGAILVLHAPISNQESWPGQTYWDAKRFLAEHPAFKLIVCGDIHLAFNINLGARRIINTGPLLRRAADEADAVPHFYIYDTEKNSLEKINVEHADAEDVISRAHLERERAYKELVDQLKSPDAALDAKTDIRFGDILNEVAKSNKDKINKNVVRLMSTIAGINLEEKHGKQKAASRR